MINIDKLRRLAQAAISKMNALDPEFVSSVTPLAVLELLDRLQAAENDAAHQKALAESALRVAEGWERKCGELRAKVEQMERQEPIGEMSEVSPHNYELRWYRPVPFGAKLYALPGAKGEEK